MVIQAQKRKNMRAFHASPFTFGKEFFTPRNSAQPEFTLGEAYRHFSNTYAHPDRTSNYNDFPDAPDVMPPAVPFPKQTPSFEEVENCVRRARHGSAPGPNGIPYIVWKYCPSLKGRLYTICQKIWSTGKTPSSWSQAVIVLFHKSGTTSDLTSFLPIALSNCDGKLFFSLLSKSFTSYMIRNEYFDRQIQKGFLPKYLWLR